MATLILEPPFGLEITTWRGERDFGDSDSSDYAASFEVSVVNLEDVPKYVSLAFEGQHPDKPHKRQRRTVTHGRVFSVKKDRPRKSYFRLRKMDWTLTGVTVKAAGKTHHRAMRHHASDFNLKEKPARMLGLVFAWILFACVVFIVLRMLG